MKARAVSPAKVILFGEHFVVGGNTAISMTIDFPTTVTVERESGERVSIESRDLHVKVAFSQQGEIVESVGSNAETALRPVFEAVRVSFEKLHLPCHGLSIMVESRVPIGMGLGSSAATAVGTVSAIGELFKRPFTQQEIFDAAYSLERMVHGHPSGVDQATITYGGLVCYRNGAVDSRLGHSSPPTLLIGNTGKRRSTGEFVGKVTRLRKEQPEEYAKIAFDAQKIAESAIEALRDGRNEDVGSLMNANQVLLEKVGVSSPELEKLIAAARSARALGAKLTGGGGGGCMIAIADKSKSKAVVEAIERAGGQVLPSAFVPYGVRASLEED